MRVIECDVPSSSMLDRDLIAISYFHDSYRTPLTHPELGIVDIFFALFGHEPLWMKVAFGCRRAVTRIKALRRDSQAH